VCLNAEEVRVEVVPIRVRSQEKVPKKVLSYGEFVPLKKIIEDLELENPPKNRTDLFYQEFDCWQ